MKAIYKYQLRITGEYEICVLGANPEIVKAGLDPQGTPCVWVIVEPESKISRPLNLLMVGTGHPLSDMYPTHIESFNHGEFAWHLFGK